MIRINQKRVNFYLESEYENVLRYKIVVPLNIYVYVELFMIFKKYCLPFFTQ